VTGLVTVVPSLTSGVADAIQTWQRWDLAKPATNVAAGEFLVGAVAGGKDLSHGARVELVVEVATRVGAGLGGVGLELGRLCQGAQASSSAPLRHDRHIIVPSRSRHIRNYLWTLRGNRNREYSLSARATSRRCRRWSCRWLVPSRGRSSLWAAVAAVVTSFALTEEVAWLEVAGWLAGSSSHLGDNSGSCCSSCCRRSRSIGSCGCEAVNGDRGLRAWAIPPRVAATSPPASTLASLGASDSNTCGQSHDGKSLDELHVDRLIAREE
jgi:hypothetical protein